LSTPSEQQKEKILDFINNGDVERIGDFFYTSAAKAKGIVKVRPAHIGWTDYTLTTAALEPAETDPADIDEAMRWCVVVDNIPECDADTAGIVYLDPETGNVVISALRGPAHDHDVAIRMVARDLKVEQPEAPTRKTITMPAAAAPRRAANENTPGKAAGFIRTSTTALMESVFAPIKWIIPGYVPEGLVLLAGKQKLGKTWMAIDWAAAVATGGRTMGIECERGDVLYIDMENGDRRIQRRIIAMWPFKPSRPDLTRLEWASASPVIGKDFYAALDEWYASVDNPRLVIIDVLQRIKPTGSVAKNAYENDYAALTGLQQWATVRSVAVVALHHLKKGGSDSDDPFEKLSGSNGLSACADTTLVLDRNGQGCTLYGRGRDVEEIESAVTFDKTTFRWRVQGNVTDVRRSDERGNILQALADAGEPMSPNVIADVTGMKPGNVRRLLLSMVTAGEAHKTGRGRYAHPDVTVETPTPGNNGNKVTTPRDDRVGNKVTEGMVGDDDHPLDETIVTVVTDVTAPLGDETATFALSQSDDPPGYVPAFLRRAAA